MYPRTSIDSSITIFFSASVPNVPPVCKTAFRRKLRRS